MNKPTQCIILGGGVSIKEEIAKGLWKKLENHFVIGLNYSYNFFDSTILSYVDGSGQFYDDERKKEKFQKLPLIIGKKPGDIKILPNTIILQTNDVKYFRDIKLGCYKSNLVGLFALSLAIYLLDEGEIYLLGYDYGFINGEKDNKGRRITHFYQGEIKHRGIGKTNYFDTVGRADKDFGVYKNEKKVKIYNVSMKSKINTFPKISYDEFFKRLGNQKYDQNIIREYIRKELQ